MIQEKLIRGGRRPTVRAAKSIALAFTLAFIAIFALTRCSGNESSRPSTSPANEVSTDARVQAVTGRLTVVDTEGAPVAHAKVMIGAGAGVPFSGNLVETDGAGNVTGPAGWTNAQPVTIEAPGYVRATYFSQTPRATVFKIRHASAPKPLRLEGTTTGFGTLARNGTLDVSLVFPAVPRSEASSMELTQLIGSRVDKISVYGETIHLPANLSIPLQSESVYVVVPVTLDKPTYRTYVAFAGTYRFAAVHAQFDFKRTIEDFQAGKSFFDVINRIDFRSYTTRDFSIRLPAQTADLPLGENELTSSVPVRATALPTGYAMLATTFAERDGKCVVTDVKRLLDGEGRTLKAASGASVTNLLVRTLKKYDSTRVDFSGADYEEASAIVTTLAGATPATPGATSDATSSSFLPLLAPIRTQRRELVLTPPVLPPGLEAGLTQVTLSKVEVANEGDLTLLDKTPAWDLYAPGFAASMELPVMTNEPWASSGRYRWELRYGASEGSQVDRLSPEAMGDMSHVVKTAIDFTVP